MNIFEAGVKLVVNGGTLVKATFAEIASSGKKMWAEIAAGEKSANPVLKGISAAANEAKAGIKGMAEEAGGVGRVFASMGAAGVAAAAVIGAAFVSVKFAIDKARGDMSDALEVDNASKKLQISAQALQEWRFVAQEATGDGKNFDEALDGLEGAIGKVTAQVGRSKIIADTFKKLGIPPESLKSYSDAENLIEVISQKFQGLDQEKRKAFADKLGLTPILPVLDMATGKIAEMRAEANRLGLVIGNTTVKELAELERHTKLEAEVIDHDLKRSFLGLGPVIADVVDWLAKATRGVDDFIEQFKKIPNRSEQALSDEIDEGLSRRAKLQAASDRAKHGDLGMIASDVTMKVLGGGGLEGAIKRQDALLAQYGAEYAKKLAADDAAGVKYNPPKDVADTTTHHGSPTAANDRLQRANDEVEQAELRGVDARIKLAHDAKDKLDLELSKIAREAEKRDADLDSQVRDYRLSKGKKGLSPEERARIAAANGDTDAVSRQDAQYAYDTAVRERGEKEKTYRLEVALKVAQESRDKEAEESLQRQIDLIKRAAELREHFLELGMSPDEADQLARLNASMDENRIAAARTVADLQVTYHAKTADDPGGYRNDLIPLHDMFNDAQKSNDEFDDKRIDKLADGFGKAFEKGLDAALHGEKLKKVLAEWMLKGAEDGLDNVGKNLFAGLLHGGRDGQLGQAGSWVASMFGVNHQAFGSGGSAPSGTPSWLTAAESLFGFGGGHAAGGPMSSGMYYNVGEGGPELAMVGAGGSMFSQDQTANILRNAVGASGARDRAGPNVTMHSTYNVAGYVSDRDLTAKLGALHQKTVSDTLDAVREAMPEMAQTHHALRD